MLPFRNPPFIPSYEYSRHFTWARGGVGELSNRQSVYFVMLTHVKNRAWVPKLHEPQVGVVPCRPSAKWLEIEENRAFANV